MYNQATEQSYTSFDSLLSNSKLLVNFSVWQVIESILGIFISIALIRKMMVIEEKQWINSLKYIPGIICFVALFYLQSYLFLVIRTESFILLALAIAIGLGLFITLLAIGFKWLIHEYDLRCEIKFLLHVLQIIVASILYISVSGLPINKLPEYGSLPSLGWLGLLAGICAIIGYLLYFIRLNQQMKQLRNQS
jgi:uncharacterized membrane protein